MDSEDSDQTERMPRLIWAFAECTVILLVLSYCGSFQLRLTKPMQHKTTVKILKIGTPEINAVITVKFEQCRLTIQ